MIDTVSCTQEADLTHAFFEKLLLGGINKVVDRDDVRPASGHQVEASYSEPQQPHAPPHRPVQSMPMYQGPWAVNERPDSRQYNQYSHGPESSYTQAQTYGASANSTPRFDSQTDTYGEWFQPAQPQRQTMAPRRFSPQQTSMVAVFDLRRYKGRHLFHTISLSSRCGPRSDRALLVLVLATRRPVALGQSLDKLNGRLPRP